PRDGKLQAGTKYRLMEEIAAYLRTAAAKWPLVVLLDEMQWADEASWDTLDHLVEQFTHEQIMICVTMRTGVEFTPAAERRAALGGRAGYQELEITRLTRDEVKRWLEASLDHQDVAREFLAYVYRQTEGNPFLLTQLVRCLAEEGSLWRDGEQWQWKPVSELRLPAGVDGILSRRLARFSPTTRAVFATAAVVRREFDAPLLEAAGAGSASAVDAAIEEGLEAGVLQYTYERRRKAFLFTHQSMADVLARGLSAEDLRAQHDAVARAMERRGEGTAAEIALHYDAAEATGAAYRMSLVAAADAEAVYALQSARDLLQTAVRNAGTPGELAETRVRLAQIADALGQYDEEEELCDLAIDWFAGQDDDRRALTLRRMRERARKELGQPARRSLEALRALDEAAAKLGFDEERVALLTLLSQVHGRLGDPREASRIAAECVAIAEHLGDASLLAEALNRLAITLEPESPARAREHYQRALELFRETGDVRGQVRCYNNLGIVAQLESRIDTARESLTMAISLARAAGMPDVWGTAALNFGVMSQKLGDLDGARDLFGEALSLFAKVKNSELQLYALFNMAHVERERDEYTSAAELYESTASLAQRIGQSDVEIGARAGEGLCLLAMGRLDDARRPLAEAESRMATRSEWFQGRELVECLRVLVAAAEGRHTDALQQFESARALADASDLFAAAWLTAVCATALFAIDRGVARAAVERYATRVATLGFTALTERFRALEQDV
ncbi:MAG TPA: tetratricopeptide repeat protein, partial [Gemmatimonadaceae bacterium]|nr:tetratricopeptide repeat protein [Gemmatimonadaceae bacterium]